MSIAFPLTETLSPILNQTDTGAFPPIQPEPPLHYDYLNRLLYEAGPFPNPTALFGMGDDGFPVILELNNPAAGTLFLVADPMSGQRALMQAVLYSLTVLNHHLDAAFYALSTNLDWLDGLRETPHCLGVEKPWRRSADALILHLVEVTDARRAGRMPGPEVVLVLDDLPALLPRFDGEIHRDLQYLMAYGPSQGVWPLVHIPSTGIRSLKRAWLSRAGTLITGHIENQGLAQALSPDDAPRASWLRRGLEFGAFVKGRWVRFVIPVHGRYFPAYRSREDF